MRYRCKTCGSFVKDKFIFGLLHVCLSDEEIAMRNAYRLQAAMQQRQRMPDQSELTAMALAAGKSDGVKSGN